MRLVKKLIQSAGLHYAIKLEKEDFIGKQRLVQIKEEGQK